MESEFEPKLDCRWFIGEKPCRFKRLCPGCPHYAPMGARILIIKLAALGDVLRTTAILGPLQAAFDPCQITWVTDSGALPLLSCADGIDRLMGFGFEAVHCLLAERFDLAICLDKEPRALALINRATAGKKLGFGISRWGTPLPLNREAEYAFRLGLDDDLKFFQNQLTYQQIACQALGLGEPKEGYRFQPPQSAIAFADEFLAAKGLDPARTVGLNTGAGEIFAHKAWLPERFAALADWLSGQGYSPLLLGGPAERELNQTIAGLCNRPVADSQGEHDLVQFAGLAGRLRMLITSDSLAMHLSLAQQVPTVVLFGSTCPQEIMLTAPGALIRAGLDCQPCYRKSCDIPEHCMKSLKLDTVQAEVQRVLEESA